MTKRWVIENGIGHWEITLNGKTVSCDDGELTAVIAELEAEDDRNGTT